MLTDLAPPAAAAAQIEALAAQLRLPVGYVDEPDGRARLAALIEAAVCHVESRTGRSLLRRSFLLTTASWPDDGRLEVPTAPVVRVIGLDLVASDGARSAVDISAVAVDALGAVPVVRLTPGSQWPTIPVGGWAELVLEAGYGVAWTDVPADLRLAVIMMAASLHDTGLAPEALAVPFAVIALTEPYRRVRL